MDILGLLLISLAQENDGVLIQRLKSRDPQALSDAYDLYGRIAFAVILRIVHDASDAEDLVQETFLRVWNRAAQISDQYSTVGPWLLAIARNCALDHIKSSFVRAAKRNTAEETDIPAITIDHEILNSDSARVLGEAIDQLNVNQRKVIELAYYEGLSQQEIARKLSLPLGTVKGLTRSALQRLRGAISEDMVSHR